MQDTTADELKRIVLRYVPRQNRAIELTQETLLQESAGIDSPRMIDVLLDIEDYFGIKLEESQFQSTRSFGDLVGLIDRMVRV